MSLVNALKENLPTGAHLIGCAFAGDPAGESASWAPLLIEKNKHFLSPPARSRQNLYVCVSCFSRKARRKEHFVCMLAVMIDDVGTKIPLDRVTLEPTWKIETSPGNFQYWYLLSEPIRDRVVAENLINALIDAGLSLDGKDPGMAGVTRLGRADGGVNGKKKYAGWRVRGEETGAGEYRPVELVEAFGLDREAVFSTRPTRRAVSGAAEGVEADEVKAALMMDFMGRFLVEEGLTGEDRVQGGTPWVPMLCPWASEHTGGDTTGTAYLPSNYSDGNGGFKCHHGHCQERNMEDLRAWAREKGWKDRWSEGGTGEGGEPPPPDTCEDNPTASDALLTDEERLVQYTYVTELDKFVSPSGVRVGRSALAAHSQVQVVRVTDETGKLRRMKPVDWMLSEAPAELVIADRMGWHPGRGRIYEHHGTRYLNRWTQPAITVRGDEPMPWTQHVRTLYPEHAEHIMDWLAFTVQRPEVKINHALVLGGEQGIGKNMLLHPLELLPNFTRCTDLPTVMSGFQDWVYEKKLVILEEAKRTRNFCARDVHNKLKSFLAAPPRELEINPKYRSRVVIPNVVNLCITTNYTDSLHVDPEERRYLMLFATWKEVGASLTREYFRSLGAWYADGGIAHVLGYLAVRDVSRFDPAERPPCTEHQYTAREESIGEREMELRDHLDEAEAVSLDDVYTIADTVSGYMHWTKKKLAWALKDLGWVRIRNPSHHEGKWIKRIHGRRRNFSYWAHRHNEKALLQAQKLFAKVKEETENE